MTELQLQKEKNKSEQASQTDENEEKKLQEQKEIEYKKKQIGQLEARVKTMTKNIDELTKQNKKFVIGRIQLWNILRCKFKITREYC